MNDKAITQGEHILRVQGIRVVDDGGEDDGTVLLALDAEICYYHRPFLIELLDTAKAMIMAHSYFKKLDNAYVTIESYNTSKPFPHRHFSLNCETGKWQNCKPKV